MLKQKLKNREICFVVNIDYPSPGLAAAIGQCGADAVFLDCEQGSLGIESVENCARAARMAGAASLVRIHSPDEWVIERYMMRGVDGIVVPRLTSPEEAKAVVDCVRYTFPHDHDNKCIVVQIETATALGRLDEFLSIKEIDCYFLGPVDLSKSMGYKGDYQCAPVADEIAHALERIRLSGRSAGMLVKQHDFERFLALGANFLYLHADDLLSVGMKTFTSSSPTRDDTR